MNKEFSISLWQYCCCFLKIFWLRVFVVPRPPDKFQSQMHVTVRQGFRKITGNDGDQFAQAKA